MMTALITLAVLILAAGFAIVMSPSEPGGSQITINSDRNVVTVRSAGSGHITITFDPSDLGPEGPPAELLPGGETAAESERTLLEEFTDPQTSIERKREIAETFTGLNCTFTVKDREPATEAPAPAAQEPVDIILDDGDGFDEGLLFPEGASSNE